MIQYEHERGTGSPSITASRNRTKGATDMTYAGIEITDTDSLMAVADLIEDVEDVEVRITCPECNGAAVDHRLQPRRRAHQHRVPLLRGTGHHPRLRRRRLGPGAAHPGGSRPRGGRAPVPVRDLPRHRAHGQAVHPVRGHDGRGVLPRLHPALRLRIRAGSSTAAATRGRRLPQPPRCRSIAPPIAGGSPATAASPP